MIWKLLDQDTTRLRCTDAMFVVANLGIFRARSIQKNIFFIMYLNNIEIIMAETRKRAEFGMHDSLYALAVRLNATLTKNNMQVFVPYPSPIDVAKCLDPKRLRKQVIECDQILKAIYGESDAWKNHPVVKMYRPYIQFLAAYSDTLWAFQNGCDYWVQGLSELADAHRPPFLTESFCDQHKRRLYTKAPELYPQFAEYGTSEENWYFVDGEIVKYVNGKKNMSDQVNHPAHYQKNGKECIDVMIEKFGVQAVISFCECNEFKYEWRAGLKEGNSAEQDLAKAQWYRKKAEKLKNADH